LVGENGEQLLLSSLDPVVGMEVPNDVAAFLRSNPSIRRIALNGRKAEQSFRRWIGDDAQGVDVVALPSTSAANAAASLELLTERWRAALL
jgi:double-stranded uracil-DNA glycosylase